jgi:hypothetical protein
MEISLAFMPAEYMHYLLAYGCASHEGMPWRKMGIQCFAKPEGPGWKLRRAQETTVAAWLPPHRSCQPGAPSKAACMGRSTGCSLFSLRPGIHASSAWAPLGHEQKAVVANTPPKPDPSEVSA